MVIITAPIKGFLPKIKGGNCHIPISQNLLAYASGSVTPADSNSTATARPIFGLP